MKRSTPLKRRTPLPRRATPLPLVNPERKAARFARDYGERGARVRLMACLACTPATARRDNPVEAAHVKSRGAGGDRRSLVPLCGDHHRRQHAVGIKTFAAETGIDLHAEAARIAAQLDAEGYE